MHTRIDRCHVCGNPTAEERAYARIALRDRAYLICCPMCLTAIQAGAVQRRMVSPSQEVPRASVFVEYLPAVQVGGDYAWVQAAGDDRLYVVVADVSGHGITSSLVASRVAAEVERVGEGREGLAELAERLNRLMWSTFGAERIYLTLFCAVVDFQDREIPYLNCGHPPALLWSGRDCGFAPLQADHCPVGLFDAETFGRPRARRVDFEIGDRLAVYTDGVIGLRPADGPELGEAGLRDALGDAMQGGPMKEAAEGLFQEFRAKHQAHPDDDLLMVLVDLHG